MTSQSGQSFFSYDLTQWINGYANFNYPPPGYNRSVTWEAPVNAWDNNGPIYACGFTSQALWYQ